MIIIKKLAFQVGDTINNYKSMCQMLGEPENGGNQKKAQIKEWERYFNFERSGQKFLITEIYEEPLPKEDDRIYGNNSIYVKNIELILTDILSKREGYVCTLTKTNWYESLGMVNQNYKVCKNWSTVQIKEWNSDLSKFQVNHFYQQCDSILNRILFSALDNMRRRRLINYYEQYMIVENTRVDGREVRSERIANPYEESLILSAEKEALIEMGFHDIRQVYQKFKAKEYYSVVDGILNQNYGWISCYRNYRIIYTQKHMINEISVARDELAQIKLSLNGQIVEAYDQHARNKWSKNQEEIEQYRRTIFIAGFGDDYENSVPKPPFEYQWNYIEIQEWLARNLIRIE